MPLLPDEPNDEERLEELPEDYDTPFTPAEPSPALTTNSGDNLRGGGTIDVTHPATDSLEAEEAYDEGVTGAAEASEPNAGNAVLAYTRIDGSELPSTRNGKSAAKKLQAD